MHLFICVCLIICNIFVINAQISTGPTNIPDEITGNNINYFSPIIGPNSSKYKDVNQENHKPMFTQCENYKPEVKEQEDRGTPVITVNAVDNDPTDKKGGKVTYKIVKREGERVYFKINEETGQIFTNTPFDRDEPIRQKELYLTVQATDDGRPPLADICTFKVTVTDINDNSPSFDQTDYRAQVSEDLKEKSEVMRVFAYDFDDGENSRLTYSFSNDSSLFNDYFRIDSETGVVYLKQSLATKQGTKFLSTVIVQDNGDIPNRATAEISIVVVSSDKQPPRITNYNKEIEIEENFSDFETPLVNISAESNINDESVAFELVKGKTTQTNKDQTFVLSPLTKNSAVITLARQLDYETVTEYQLTVRAQNKDLLGASVNIIVKVKDVNDEIPTFIELLKGSVVENDVIGAQAMQVRAIDKDGTSPNNLVNYQLLSHADLFQINKETGVITAITVFDREKESLYHVIVKAYDKAPSAILKNKSEPNSATQTFQISIEDRNDNHPKFTESLYVVHNISESADRLKDVVEVKAVDKDDASLIIYSIIDGNIDNAFFIEETTGRIKVNSKLDYEKIESYNLTVRAFDGIYEDTTEVLIHIQNENDEPPIFVPYNKTITFKEETLSDGCIIKLQAYDPDIKDRKANQRIVYRVAKEYQSFLEVTSDGCVSLIKNLDRDEPNGSPQYQGYIYAHDNDGGSNSLSKSAEINIILIDINDNAPILNMNEVVWYENEPPGKIITLSAIDYDSDENGPPFKYEIATNLYDDIYDKFSVIGDSLIANQTFDREFKKFYDVQIKITDSGQPNQSGISILRVIIGDRNDNEARDGSSEIFVYKYEGLNQDISIGRVYVSDPDDWDLNDKIFQSDVGFDNDNFQLSDNDKGMIIMNKYTPKGIYHLTFIVTEEHLPNIIQHTVRANVTVIVRDIPEEAVRKSGSIRFKGTTIEEFIEKPEYGLSKKDLLQKHVANIMNTSYENVDVFTVFKTVSNKSFIDVRFSAHGSPYYPAEKLNNKITEYEDNLESELNIKFQMIGISECLLETVCPFKSSCSNYLNIKNEPAVIFTNKTSFVGVNAIIEPICDCSLHYISECYNGGTPIDGGICSCPDGFDGPHCELLSIGFNGNGWAMYPTFDACNHTDISLSISPQTDDGLIFYVGPLTLKHAEISKDFMSLELRNGYIVLKLDLGYGPIEVISKYKKINDGALHKIKISFTTEDVQIEVDECHSDCLTWKAFNNHGLLNVNGPLQIGGLKNMFSTEESKLIWQQIHPTHKGFVGCIKNFTYNSYVYNLGLPSDSYQAHINCNYGVTQAVTFGIDTNFLVAILVCIAILLILLLAVVVHRRKHDNLNIKDIDDTRENIINYEDEGGGECDTNFDLSVLRPNPDEKSPIRDNIYQKGIDQPAADISGFLDNKKHSCDKDPDNLPYDDVRHYAYEGDGNSSGSLSSLASCTDEGDLKFNYLSNFGPRFRKLADIYGEDASEEGSQNGGEESWC